MTTVVKDIKVYFDEISFQFVFKDTPEIVPEDLLKKKAENHGFEIEKGERIFRSPVGEIIVLNIGRKGGIDLLYDPRESFIGIGTKTGDISILRNHVENTLLEIIRDLELQDTAKFYRVIARGKAWYGRDTKVILKNVVKVEQLNKIEDMISSNIGLDVRLQPMTLRLIPADKNFGEFPWIDVVIEPLVANPKYYYYSLAYMDSDYSRSIQVLESLKDLSSQLIMIIGGEQK